MTAYYNEIDPFAAAWLRELIKAGLIAPGIVDERSIEDVIPEEIKEFTQCHFFAGIGVWSYALRRAGWPDNRPVWTGSCPCGPFSEAGEGAGFADERHLWPAFFHLIQHGKDKSVPVVGEQVADGGGLAWCDLVQADLERGSGHAFGCVDTCAAGFGAPHIRQRLYWLAYTACEQHNGSGIRRPRWRSKHSNYGPISKMADTISHGLQGSGKHHIPATGEGQEGPAFRCRGIPQLSQPPAPGPLKGFWGNADWLFCRDGRWRPAEPSTFPLVNGATARVGRLRGYGNAIVAPQAQAFCEAVIDFLEVS